MIFGFHFIDLVVIVAYLLLMTGIGMYTAKKVKTMGDYFLGGRKFGKILTIARDFGMGTNAEDPVVVVGQSYSIGLAGVWYSLIAMFVTPFYWLTKAWFRRLRCYTMGDVCEKRFGKWFGCMYSVFGVVQTAVMIGLILRSTGSVIVGISGSAMPLWGVILFMAVLFMLYGAFGGQFAAVFTDVFQIFFIVVLTILLIPLFVTKAGGIDVAARRIPDAFFNLTSAAGVSEVTLSFIVMATIVSINAAMGHPSAATVISKTELESRIGMVGGNLVKRLCTVTWAFSGLLFLAVQPGLTARDQVFGVAITHILPVGILGLMLACLMATSMSACDGFMVISGSYFLSNFYKKIFNDKSPAHYLAASRVASLCAAGLGVFFAFIFPSMVEAFKFTWVLLSFLGIPIWIAIAWRRINRYGALAAIVTAIIAYSICTFYKHLSFVTTSQIYLPLSYAALFIVSILTPREPQGQLDEFYALLHTPVGQEKRLGYAQVEVMHY